MGFSSVCAFSRSGDAAFSSSGFEVGGGLGPFIRAFFSGGGRFASSRSE